MTEAQRKARLTDIVARRNSGESFRSIGNAHSITIERARSIFVRETTRKNPPPDIPDDHDWSAPYRTCRCARCRAAENKRELKAERELDRLNRRDQKTPHNRCVCPLCGKSHKRAEPERGLADPAPLDTEN